MNCLLTVPNERDGKFAIYKTVVIIFPLNLQTITAEIGEVRKMKLLLFG